MEKHRRTAFSHSSMATVTQKRFFHGKRSVSFLLLEKTKREKLAVLVAEADNTVYAYPLEEGLAKKGNCDCQRGEQDAIDQVTLDALKANRSGKLRLEILLCGGFQDWESHQCF